MCLVTGAIKLIVFVLNFVFSIIGIVLIAVGSWAYVQIKDSANVTNENYTYATGFVIGVGVFVFIVSFLGCCGVCQNSKWMLYGYAGILLILFILQITAGAIGYSLVSNDDFKNEIKENLNKTFKDPEAKEIYIEFQKTFKCCGVNGKDDYMPKDAPPSCCEETKSDIDKTCKTYYEGCVSKLSDIISTSNLVVAYVALGIAVVELVGAAFGYILGRNV